MSVTRTVYHILSPHSIYDNDALDWNEVIEAAGWADKGYQVFEFTVHNGKLYFAGDVTDRAAHEAERLSESTHDHNREHRLTGRDLGLERIAS